MFLLFLILLFFTLMGAVGRIWIKFWIKLLKEAKEEEEAFERAAIEDVKRAPEQLAELQIEAENQKAERAALKKFQAIKRRQQAKELVAKIKADKMAISEKG